MPEAEAELVRAAEMTESTFAIEDKQFELLDARVAVGGQLMATFDDAPHH